MQKKAIVSGASGCSGISLINFLRKEGCEVYTLGRSPQSESHFNVEFPLDHRKIDGIVKVIKPDYFFHLAGVLYADSFHDYCSINVNYASVIIDALIAHQPECALLLVGSAAEYGYLREDQVPVDESLVPAPKTLYGLTKWLQTQLGAIAADKLRHIVLARPFNIVGAHLNDALVLRTAANQLREVQRGNAKDLEFGNLNISRDFVDVDVVSQVYWELINNDDAHAKVLNICSGQPGNVGELIDRMKELCGVTAPVKSSEARFRKFDSPVHYGCNEALKKVIGYAPGTIDDNTLSGLLASSDVELK